MNETVLSFSGGRTSAYMTIKFLEQRNDENVVIIFSNTGKENEETLRFVDNCDQYIQSKFGKSVIWVEYDTELKYKVVDYKTASRNGEPFMAMIKKKNFTPNRVMRFCTVELKINVMKNYCKDALKWSTWDNVVGIRYDEPKRWAKEKKKIDKNFDVLHPLVSWKTTKKDVLAYWKTMPFDLELKDYEGNCDLCFLKGMKKKQMILREHPEKAEWWAMAEESVNGRFHNDYSFRQLLDFIRRQPQLFGIDDSIDCFCGD